MEEDRTGRSSAPSSSTILPLGVVSVRLPAHEASPLVTHTTHIQGRSGRWWSPQSYDQVRRLVYGGMLVVLLTFGIVASVIKHKDSSSSGGVPSSTVAVHKTPATNDSLPLLKPTDTIPTDMPAMSVGPDARLGVCYDPQHHWAYPGNVPQVFGEDMPLVARHFRSVRTFYANYYGTDIMPFIAGAGLRAALGVSIANGLAEAEKGAAIRAWYEHGANLAMVLVGNEDLHPVGPFTVDDIIFHITDLRKAGVQCPIGTVQRINEWLVQSPEIDRLAAASDIIGVNIYPYFSTPHNDGEAWEMLNVPVENMRKQFEAVRGRFPGQEWKVRIMETGWPTSGPRNFAGHDANMDMGAKYYYGFVSWACAQDFDSYYFEYFDKRWATSPPYEQFFGVVDADGNPKYNPMSNGFC